MRGGDCPAPVRTYTALDLETTGLDPKMDRILEIGAVRVTDGRETARFSRLVNPGREIGEKVTELTGITGEMVENCPHIAAALPEFLEFCGDVPILGHNILFDFRFLKRAAVNHGFSFERKGIDTLALCRRFMPAGEKKNLGAACRYFGVETGRSHRALDDARAAHELYREIARLRENEDREAFLPKPLEYKIKREQPASKRQKEVLRDLLKYHKITLSAQIDDLSRNEISRITDKIILKYGRIL